jgi:hypothetical protein
LAATRTHTRAAANLFLGKKGTDLFDYDMAHWIGAHIVVK